MTNIVNSMSKQLKKSHRLNFMLSEYDYILLRRLVDLINSEQQHNGTTMGEVLRALIHNEHEKHFNNNDEVLKSIIRFKAGQD